MSLEEIKKLLETTGLPVAYRAFPVGNAPPLPFVCYLFSSTNNFNADDAVYQLSTASPLNCTRKARTRKQKTR